MPTYDNASWNSCRVMVFGLPSVFASSINLVCARPHGVRIAFCAVTVAPCARRAGSDGRRRARAELEEGGGRPRGTRSPRAARAHVERLELLLLEGRHVRHRGDVHVTRAFAEIVPPEARAQIPVTRCAGVAQTYAAARARRRARRAPKLTWLWCGDSHRGRRTEVERERWINRPARLG